MREERGGKGGGGEGKAERGREGERGERQRQRETKLVLETLIDPEVRGWVHCLLHRPRCFPILDSGEQRG